MQECRVNSWHEFEFQISELDGYLLSKRPNPILHQGRPLYRGHADATWGLVTTLERYSDNVNSLLDYNRSLLRIKPAIESYTGKSWEVERDWKVEDPELLMSPPSYEFMVYARHHGFPSPLLDWSESPYIALYFAFAENSPSTDASVFAYVSTPEGFKSGSVSSPKILQIGPYATTHARHFTQQAQYTICVQSIDGNLQYNPHESVFSSGNDSQDLLRKITLPSSMRVEVLRRLQLMNINAYSLFGSDESLMRMLAFKEILLRNS